ncbi:MAG: response regulator transcription factor [Planctomycetota bacterium]|jgi:RNA polymerase sigma factor (sigma-70 family)
MTDPIPIIHVIDDDDSVRKAVTRLLKAAGYEAQGYANAGEFLIATNHSGPGCIVLDVRMPGPSGLELHAALKKREILLPVIFLTGHGDIPMSVQAIKAGAVDFLTKPVQRQTLLTAVSNALEIQRQSNDQQQRVDRLRACYDSLSERERAVLRLVVQGKLNKQIGVLLGIAERTVKAHRAQAMEKMQAASLADLVRVASELGLGGQEP